MLHSRVLAITGLILLLGGAVSFFMPVGFIDVTDHSTHSVGPELEDCADIPLSIDYPTYANITVVFDQSADSGQREIWPITTYQTPTKTISETVRRLINQSEVMFTFGWRNATYLLFFVTGFKLRIFYHGEETVHVSVTVTRKVKLATYLSIGLMSASIVPFGALVVKWRSSRRSKRPLD
ncbi:MAG: hypothetical protein ACFFEU_15640 [Candidatus Thorarchaeota archaeon]